MFKSRIACALILGLVLLAAPAAFAAGPSVAKTAGKTYGEWSAAWWQWAYSFNVSESPLVLDGAVDCTAGQQGPVWFLAGTVLGAGPRERSCDVPTGKNFFFPVTNIVYLNEPGENLTVAQKRAAIGGFLDDSEPGFLTDFGLPGSEACDLQVTLDGAQLTDTVPMARVQSPPFRAETADDPIAFPPNLVDEEAVSDGFYVMLPALSAGPHTLRIQGRICEYQTENDHPFFGGVDVTYQLNVVGGQASNGGNGGNQGAPATQDNVAIIQSLYDAFASGDGATILAILDEDVVWIESEGIPYGGTFIGRDAVFAGVFDKIGAEWDGFTATVDAIFAADGNRVIVQQRDGGTFKATGKSMLASAISIWTLDHQGRAIRFEQVIDTQEVNSATIP